MFVAEIMRRGLSGQSGLICLSGSFHSTEEPDQPDRADNPNNGLLRSHFDENVTRG